MAIPSDPSEIMDGLIYAYHVPKSEAQQAYTRQRIAQLAEERKQRKLSAESTDYLERITTVDSDRSSKGRHQRNGSNGGMEATRANTSSTSSSSSHSEVNHHTLLNNPFELRHGRRYLRELPYPLPVDLAEMQRQNLRTLLGCRVFGKAICSPNVARNVPRKVLEVGCGSGYWSSMCHDYFSSLGHRNVAFTGLDVASLAPDLKKQNVNWTFIQHDIRRLPLPFDDEEFDLIMLKDISLALPLGAPSQKFLDESIRILKEGGTLEIWESDHVLRSLLPHPPPPPSKQPHDQEMAERTATFLIAPGTPFAQAQNKFLQQANSWVSEALDRRKLPPTPCARLSQVLLQEPDSLKDVGNRRVAVPLGELHWEREGFRNAVDSPMAKGKGRVSDSSLTADQLAMRQTALLTVLQNIESLEPLLREVSGKNSEEWTHWWALMMNNLLDPAKGAVTGECLELGAWWATKRSDD